MEIIRIENIIHSYGRKEVLRGVTLGINAGDMLAVTGENGSGKSTLLKIMSLLLKPDEGQIYYRGQLTDLTREKERDAYRRDKFGVITQDFSLLYDKKVIDNIALPLQAQKLPKKVIRQKTEQMITELGLEHLSGKYPDSLSGGECQKVAIARALVKQPEILLADELTASLDQENKEEIMGILSSQARQGGAVVIVTHDCEVLRFVSGIYHLQDGKLLGTN